MADFLFNFEKFNENFKFLSKYIFDKYRIASNMVTAGGDIIAMVHNDNNSFQYENTKVSVRTDYDIPVGNDDQYARPIKLVMTVHNTTAETATKIVSELISAAEEYCNTKIDGCISVYRAA